MPVIENPYPITWAGLLGLNSESVNIYAQQGVIPVGTIRPCFEYDGEIPLTDIIYLPFDHINHPDAKRKPFNILVLGGSGDGKSNWMKLPWSILHDAGYYVIYIDPKSTHCGRAKKPINKFFLPRLPPNLIPKGIKLKHYMPVNAVSNMERWTHNFKIYSLRLNNITEREMWMALGFSKVGSSKMAKIVEKYNDRINLDLMRKAIGRLRAEDDINVASLGSIYDKLSDVEASGLFDTSKHRELDMMADWKDGNSICISYNARNKMFMSFDIGEKIFRCAKLYNSGERETPVFFIFDDSSYYADHIPEAYVDYAVQEISAIGFHYRTSKIYNMMAVHSLGIINSNVAEGYPIKIITHQFAKPESLAEINVPRQAIDMLKYNLLYKNKDRHVYQWILINENNEVIPFFPFMPVCNHFEEVYFPRDAKDINKEIINNEVEA